MTLDKLLSLLETVKTCHPEAGDAEVWAVKGKLSVHVTTVGFDKKRKPFRIKLGEG